MTTTPVPFLFMERVLLAGVLKGNNGRLLDTLTVTQAAKDMILFAPAENKRYCCAPELDVPVVVS